MNDEEINSRLIKQGFPLINYDEKSNFRNKMLRIYYGMIEDFEFLVDKAGLNKDDN